jgi:hypothetical protein
MDYMVSLHFIDFISWGVLDNGPLYWLLQQLLKIHENLLKFVDFYKNKTKFHVIQLRSLFMIQCNVESATIFLNHLRKQPKISVVLKILNILRSISISNLRLFLFWSTGHHLRNRSTPRMARGWTPETTENAKNSKKLDIMPFKGWWRWTRITNRLLITSN